MVPPLNTINMRPHLSLFFFGRGGVGWSAGMGRWVYGGGAQSGNWGKKTGDVREMKLAVF